MFVVRYLMVAVALVAGIILWGVAADLGFWPILRLVGLAVLALQAGVFAFSPFPDSLLSRERRLKVRVGKNAPVSRGSLLQ